MGCFYKFRVILFFTFLIGVMQVSVNGMKKNYLSPYSENNKKINKWQSIVEKYHKQSDQQFLAQQEQSIQSCPYDQYYFPTSQQQLTQNYTNMSGLQDSKTLQSSQSSGQLSYAGRKGIRMNYKDYEYNMKNYQKNKMEMEEKKQLELLEKQQLKDQQKQQNVDNLFLKQFGVAFEQASPIIKQVTPLSTISMSHSRVIILSMLDEYSELSGQFTDGAIMRIRDLAFNADFHIKTTSYMDKYPAQLGSRSITIGFVHLLCRFICHLKKSSVKYNVGPERFFLHSNAYFASMSMINKCESMTNYKQDALNRNIYQTLVDCVKVIKKMIKDVDMLDLVALHCIFTNVSGYDILNKYVDDHMEFQRKSKQQQGLQQSQE